MSNASRTLRGWSVWCGIGIIAFALGRAETIGLHAIDLKGRGIERLNPPGAKVVVLIFGGTDCPVSNRYIPEIKRIENEYSTSRAVFWWVFANPGDTLAMVRQHGQEFKIRTPTLIDTRQELVRMAHAAVTPEAAVFAVDNDKLREVYHGRIDDRYIAFGTERPYATRHDLDDTIKAVLTGRPVAQAFAAPVGCSIIPLSVARSGPPS